MSDFYRGQNIDTNNKIHILSLKNLILKVED